MTKKRILIVIAILLIAVLIVRKNFTKGDDNSNRVISVQIEKVQKKSIRQIVSATGNIRPVREVSISANVSAEIIDITVEEGEMVHPGQTLVILDSLRYAASVQQARSALRASEAGFQKMEAEYQRGINLFQNQLISNQEIETLEASYKLRQAEVEQSRAHLEQAEDDFHKTVLKAPIAGTVTSLRKEVGEMALGSMFQADVILSISDLTLMEVVVSVDETDVVDLKLRNSVEIEIDALPDVKLDGTVTQIAQSAETSNSLTSQDQVINYLVNVMVDMSTMDLRIRPGMSATANITIDEVEDAIAIPIQALAARPKKENKNEDVSNEFTSIYDKEKEELEDVVFIVTKPEKNKSRFSFGQKKGLYTVQKRPVSIGISSANFYEITIGLEEGEEIVVGSYRAISKELKDGHRVKKKKRGEKEKGK